LSRPNLETFLPGKIKGVGRQVIRFGVQDLLQPITVKIPHDWIPQTSDNYEKVEVKYGVKDHASNTLKTGSHKIPWTPLVSIALKTPNPHREAKRTQIRRIHILSQ